MVIENLLLQSDKNSNLKKIFTILVITMPILNIYVSPLPLIGAGEFVLFILMPTMVINMLWRRKWILLHEYWLFFYYGLMISMFVVLFNPSISISNVGNRLLRDAFYVCIIFVFAQKFFNADYAIKIYKIITVIACTYVFLQYISFYILGFTLPWKIPGIDIRVAMGTDAFLEHLERMYRYNFRPTSIFLEPAHFAQYAAACLVLLLFPYNNQMKVNIKLAVYISVAMILSTSANGYAFVLLIWSIWYYNSIMLKRYNNIISLVLISIVAIIAFSYLCDNSSSFELVINRFINIGDGETSSANVRLLRGFYIFKELNPVFQIFGIGFGSYEDFSSLYSITTSVYHIDAEYMSSISYILVSAGIIGFFMYIAVLYKIFKTGSVTAKALIVLLLAMVTSSSIYSSPIYVIILCFALYSSRRHHLSIVQKNKINIVN